MKTASVKIHNCKEDTVWQNTADYNMIYCESCSKIIKFRFKSTCRQIKSLFWNRVN